MSSSEFNFDEDPISEGPNESLTFRVVALGNPETDGEDNGEVNRPALFEFAPMFYPDRFVHSFDKELRREGQQCRGEDVSIKNLKNSEFHATGVVLEENLRRVQALAEHDGVVDMFTPVSPNEGMECYIKGGDVGEIEGWNPVSKQWMFSYTFDFVSTGLDEFGNDTENDIVSEIIE
ncbi:hypothetical protein HRTV-13_gp24 [Halorubrum phage HRTV-13]|uniref:Uncharacterized protein n=1 Tax=Halorubrum phage HRTV-13 TaxID=2877993 RepID=A0AAE8XUZ8_9CAUD|nr:hypothetical protein HRTV-13_gp24 [Halorubrum phage HRTV-13]